MSGVMLPATLRQLNFGQKFNQAGQFNATSPDLTLNGGLHREFYQNGLKLEAEIRVNYPDQGLEDLDFPSGLLTLAFGGNLGCC